MQNKKENESSNQASNNYSNFNYYKVKYAYHLLLID